MTAPRPRPVWCPHDTRRLVEDAQRVEPKPRLRDWVFAPLLIASLALIPLLNPPHAKADGYLTPGETLYVNDYGWIICDTIATYPTTGGVYGVVQGVANTGHFALDDAVDVVNATVSSQCSQWWPLLQLAGQQARNAGKGMAV
ncbi:hypothetical protein AB0876_28875 [Mycobacterium sp. NPDC049093]